MSRTSLDLGLCRRYASVETATVGHFRSEGFLAPEIQCVADGVRICGPALTVSLPGDDGTSLSHAIARARPGDVLMVARENDDRHACWGAVMTAAAQAAGIVGVVIDGFVTDIGSIRASGLPVWCRGRSPVTTKKRGGGTVGGGVLLSGVRVSSGDLVLADENGVLVLPVEEAEAVADEALAIQADEPAIIARLRQGERLEQILGGRAD